MGLFSDFLTNRGLNRPEDKATRREVEQIISEGDAEVPAGFENRPGWAIMKVLGLTNLTSPPTKGKLLGYNDAMIDVSRSAASVDLIKHLANQIAREDGNAGLEQDLLIHMGIEKSVATISTGTLVSSSNTNPRWKDINFAVNDYTHRWLASDLFKARHKELVTRVPDLGLVGVDLVATVGEEPVFVERVSKGLPAFRFTTPNDGKLTSESAISLFPGKRGTVVWLGKITGPIDSNKFLMVSDSSDQEGFVLPSSGDFSVSMYIDAGLHGLEVENISVATNFIDMYIFQRVSDTHIRLDHQGEQFGNTDIPDYTVVSDTLELGLVHGGSHADSVSHDLMGLLVYDRVLNLTEIEQIKKDLGKAYGAYVSVNLYPNL
jgi:hypothetical protein